MPEPKTPEETAYLEKIIERATWAVFRADPPEGDSDTGVLNLPIAVEGLCKVIGILGAQSGILATPRDMRLFSEDAGKMILTTLKAIAARAEAGEPLDWKFEWVGKPN